jgi:hypothetical protein
MLREVAAMDPIELKKWMDPATFEPFELQLSTGEWFPVPHPEHLVVARKTSILLTFDKDRIVSDYELISNVHIVKRKHLNGSRQERRKR